MLQYSLGTKAELYSQRAVVVGDGLGMVRRRVVDRVGRRGPVGQDHVFDGVEEVETVAEEVELGVGNSVGPVRVDRVGAMSRGDEVVEGGIDGQVVDLEQRRVRFVLIWT